MRIGRLRLTVATGVVAGAAAVLATVPSAGATPAAAHRAVHHHAKFGAKLDSSIQPSNSSQPHKCREITGHGGACVRVLMEAYGRPDTGMMAPKDGTIHKIRIVAGAAGAFVPEIASVKERTPLSTSKAKIVAKGTQLHYQGQTGQNDDDEVYKVETFAVNLPVKKGQYLAVRSSSTSFLRCSSGGTHQLVYQPVITPGQPYQTTDYDDGCFLLIEAVY